MDYLLNRLVAVFGNITLDCVAGFESSFSISDSADGAAVVRAPGRGLFPKLGRPKRFGFSVALASVLALFEEVVFLGLPLPLNRFLPTGASVVVVVVGAGVVVVVVVVVVVGVVATSVVTGSVVISGVVISSVVSVESSPPTYKKFKDDTAFCFKQ